MGFSMKSHGSKKYPDVGTGSSRENLSSLKKKNTIVIENILAELEVSIFKKLLKNLMRELGGCLSG